VVPATADTGTEDVKFRVWITCATVIVTDAEVTALKLALLERVALTVHTLLASPTVKVPPLAVHVPEATLKVMAPECEPPVATKFTVLPNTTVLEEVMERADWFALLIVAAGVARSVTVYRSERSPEEPGLRTPLASVTATANPDPAEGSANAAVIFIVSTAT